MRKSKRFFVVIGLTVAIFFLARYTLRPNSSSRSSDELAWHDPPKATREVPTAVNLLAPEILNIRAPSSAYSQPTKAGSLLAVQAWKEASQTWEGLALPTSIDNRGSSPIRLRLSLEEAILPQEIGWLDIRFLVNGGRNARIQSFGTRGPERTLPWCTTPIEADSSLGPDSHHPIISLSGIPSAVMVFRILHPIFASTLCAANPLARIAEPTIAL